MAAVEDASKQGEKQRYTHMEETNKEKHMANKNTCLRSHFGSLSCCPKCQAPFLLSMGSFGDWVQCYWCDVTTWDPYIIDGIDRPLCQDCEDWLECYGIPRSPTAMDHRANVLRAILLPLHGMEEVAYCIAKFLEDPIRPGMGSRDTPGPWLNTDRNCRPFRIAGGQTCRVQIANMRLTLHAFFTA